MGEAELQQLQARIAELEQREQELVRARGEAARSEEQFRLLIRDLNVGVLLQGPKAEILVSNPRALELLDLTEDQLLGRSSLDESWNVIHEDGSDFPGPTHPVPTAIATKQPVRDVVMGVYRPAHADRVWLLVNAEPQLDDAGQVQRVICTFSDFTQRKTLEESLLEAQRLETVGVLAGGLAHDFNNLLTVILSSVDLALEDAAGGEIANELRAIQRAGHRATELTSRLLDFARKGVVDPRHVSLDAAIHDFHDLLSRLLADNVELEVSLDSAPWLVLTDPRQLEQIVLNLVSNAGDAMLGGGVIRVETSRCDLTKQRGDVPPGQYVALRVSDHGTGIAPELLPRVFEPFFTTKAMGRGTGLGLATVHGVVRQANGTVAIDSTVGEGTTVTVYLPRADERPVPAAARERVAPAERGRQTILLVDDEPSVRTLGARILESVGYRVLTAATGPEAIAASDASPDPIDLLVTDVVMPGMSGPELTRVLEPSRPDLRVLYVSGYAGTTLADLGSRQLT